MTIRDSDSEQAESFSFDGVEAVRITYHRACSEEMIRAYDQLVEIEDSEWLVEVRSRVRAEGPKAPVRHLRIYFDDGPCYEFLCTSCSHGKPL